MTKSCGSCKYSIDNVYCALHTYYNEDREPEGQLEISKDFYCSKYEPKE